MLVWAPLGEFRQVIEDRCAVRVKDVRPVLVNEDAGPVISVVSVAADMRTTVDYKHLLVALAGQPFGDDAAGETGAHDQPVKHEPRLPRTAR
jgi:hypothetical protein